MTNLTLTLSKTTPKDLLVLFAFQRDPEANHLAAFTAKDPHDQAGYLAKYGKLLTDPSVHMRTIRLNKVIVGIAKFVVAGDAELTYWLDRKWWGQGLATRVLHQFLKLEPTRPLYGRVAFDNYGSQKLLEKGGFARIGQDRGFAQARQADIDEYIYQLTR